VPLGHQIERGIFEERTVLDRGASGEHRGFRAGIADGMHHGAQAESLGLAAHRLDLLIGHTLVAAGAQAGGGEQLDEVGALALRAAHQSAQGLRIAAAVVDLAERGENARAGQHALGDAVAHHAIDGRSHALHGGEAAFEGQPRVSGGVERGVLGLVAPTHRLVLGVHVPVDVDVGVDPAGHDGEAAEVVVGLLVAGRYGLDAGALDDDLLVLQRAAFAIEDGAGLDHDSVRGRLRQGGCGGEGDEQEAEVHLSIV